MTCNRCDKPLKSGEKVIIVNATKTKVRVYCLNCAEVATVK